MKENSLTRARIKADANQSFQEFFEKSGMTRAELAQTLGINPHNLNRILDNKSSTTVGLPTTVHLRALAQAASILEERSGVDPIHRPINWVRIITGEAFTAYEEYLREQVASLRKILEECTQRNKDLDATIRIREEQHSNERRLLLARIDDLQEKIGRIAG